MYPNTQEVHAQVVPGTLSIEVEVIAAKNKFNFSLGENLDIVKRRCIGIRAVRQTATDTKFGPHSGKTLVSSAAFDCCFVTLNIGGVNRYYETPVELFEANDERLYTPVNFSGFDPTKSYIEFKNPAAQHADDETFLFVFILAEDDVVKC